MSEVSDALAIAVSEETGQGSRCNGRKAGERSDPQRLQERLKRMQYRTSEVKKFTIRKGRRKNEEA